LALGRPSDALVAADGFAATLDAGSAASISAATMKQRTMANPSFYEV
jgi:hypothetical protein